MYYLQVAMIATSTVLPALAALAVGARFQARRIKNLPLKADDWIILLALVRPPKRQSERHVNEHRSLLLQTVLDVYMPLYTVAWDRLSLH